MLPQCFYFVLKLILSVKLLIETKNTITNFCLYLNIVFFKYKHIKNLTYFLFSYVFKKSIAKFIPVVLMV